MKIKRYDLKEVSNMPEAMNQTQVVGAPEQAGVWEKVKAAVEESSGGERSRAPARRG